MELFGKVVTPGSSSLNLNTKPELLINTNNGRITLSQPVVDKIGEDSFIGFAYDANKEQGALAYLFVTKDGCKVGKKGTVSSKFHASMLKDTILSTDSKTTRLKLNVNIDNPVDYEGTILYPVDLQEELPDLTRTIVSKTEEVTIEAKEEAEVTLDPELNQGDEEPQTTGTVEDTHLQVEANSTLG